jgi:hypothetical protein
LREEIKS